MCPETQPAAPLTSHFYQEAARLPQPNIKTDGERVLCKTTEDAGHLLKSGVDLRYIQELLEDNSSKTKGVYTK